MNEKLLREWIRGTLSEASILITYDDETDDKMTVSNQYAKDMRAFMGDQDVIEKEIAAMPPGKVGSYFRDNYRALLRDPPRLGGDGGPAGEFGEIKFVLDNPDSKVRAAIEGQLGLTPPAEPGALGSAVLKILGGAGNVDAAARRKIQQIFAGIKTVEDAKTIRANTVSNGEQKLTGFWEELIEVEQHNPKVGKGEFAAALWYKDANVNPGKGEDLTVGNTNYHVKYYLNQKEGKSGFHMGGKSAWDTAIKSTVDNLTLTVGTKSPAATKHLTPLTSEDLKNLLKKALTGNEGDVTFTDGTNARDVDVKRRAKTGLFPTDKEAVATDAKNALDYFGIPNTQRKNLQDALDTTYTAIISSRDPKGPKGEVVRSPVIIATPNSFYVGQSEEVLTFKQITSGTPRGGTAKEIFGTDGPSGWAGKELLENSMLRSLIRESLLTEELTKSDRKEIEKIARKQVQRDLIDKKEIEKIARKEVEAEIKKALGVSFMGHKGKINKFVVDEIQKEVQKWLKDRATRQEVADITKAVMIKVYRALSFSYRPVIDRIKV